MTGTEKSPLVSVIITSYDMQRCADICGLLDSIMTQTILADVLKTDHFLLPQTGNYSPLEVIFIAERSRELYYRVNEYGRQIHLPGFKVLFNDGESGLSAARNVGICAAKGDIIAFVDDDTVLFPNWAEELTASFSDPSVIGVTGHALPLWEDEGISWLPDEFTWLVSCTTWFECRENRDIRNAWGMNMAFRKEAFQLCGLFQNQFGYHRGLMAEDNEFSLRVKTKTGRRIIFCPELKLWHRVHRYRFGLKYVRERACWIGYSRRNLKRLHGSQGDDLLRTEHELLHRIITRLFPKLMRELFKSPRITCRKLTLITTAMFFMTRGYLFPAGKKRG